MELRFRLTRSRAVLLAALVGVLSTGAAVAVTSSLYTDEAGAFHGCVNAKSGDLRVVAPGTACMKSEVPIDWNQIGPQGEEGEKGDPGRGLSAFTDLEGLPCQHRDGATGETVVYSDERPIFIQSGQRIETGYAPQHAFCVAADAYEPNDTRATATDHGVLRHANFGTIYPAGEDDWYVFNGTTDRRYELQPPSLTGSVGQHPSVRMDVYRNGELVATGVTAYDDPIRTAARWEFRIYGPKAAAYHMINFTVF